MFDHRSYTLNSSSWEIKLKPEKNSGLNGIRTHDLCDTGAVLYQPSYQANWELVILRVRNIPVEDEEYKWIYESSYIWTAENDMTTRYYAFFAPLVVRWSLTEGWWQRKI